MIKETLKYITMFGICLSVAYFTGRFYAEPVKKIQVDQTVPKPKVKPKNPVNSCLAALNKQIDKCTPLWVALRAIGDTETSMSNNMQASNCIMVNEGQQKLVSKCFDSSEQAMKALDGLRIWGQYTDNFDGGCWQTNYKWWGKHYKEQQDVFDPKENLRVAKVVLQKSASRNDGDIYKTIGEYHSKNNAPQKRYMDKALPAYKKYRKQCLKEQLNES